MWRALQAPCPLFGGKARVAAILRRPFGRRLASLPLDQLRELLGERAQ